MISSVGRWRGAAGAAIAMALFSCVAQAQQPTFYGGGRERGWFWYEDPARRAPAQPAAPAPDARQAALAEFERLQQQIKETQQIALIDPTPANVQAVLELNARSIRMANRFTEVAELVKWRTPGLDPTFEGARPTNMTAVQAFDRVQNEERDAAVRTLAATHGILFFFRGDCPYCHAYAPLLRRFAEQYGYSILPVSVDGGALPDFPNARRDNGTLARVLGNLGIPPEQLQVPFTVLVEPKRGEVIAVGFGVLNPEDIAARIHRTVIAMRAEGALPPAAPLASANPK
jgi:conjugal transfer pilus assembly protein TraF